MIAKVLLVVLNLKDKKIKNMSLFLQKYMNINTHLTSESSLMS